MKTPKEIGEILSTTRQKKDLSIEKVSKDTRIQPSIIRALEDGTAYNVVGKIYVMLFLKKYASYLYLDVNSLSSEYKKIYDEDKQFFNVASEPKDMSAEGEKWMTLAMFIMIFLVALVLIVLTSAKIMKRFTTKKDTSPKTEQAIPVKAKAKPKSTFSIPKKKPIRITLKGTDDVWMQIKEDGKTTFTGILKKGDTKKVKAKKDIGLWVGRAEALKLIINGNTIDDIGRGTIKDIKISRKGLKVKNKWLLKSKPAIDEKTR